jgi:hypothetical protein
MGTPDSHFVLMFFLLLSSYFSSLCRRRLRFRSRRFHTHARKLHEQRMLLCELFFLSGLATHMRNRASLTGSACKRTPGFTTFKTMIPTLNSSTDTPKRPAIEPGCCRDAHVRTRVRHGFCNWNRQLIPGVDTITQANPLVAQCRRANVKRS